MPRRTAYVVMFSAALLGAIAFTLLGPVPSTPSTSSSLTAALVEIPDGAYIPPQGWNGGYVFDNRFFSPNTITVKTGESVKWTNQDTSPHTVTSHRVPAGARSFDSGILDPGKSFIVVFTQPGVYEYHCSLHPFAAGKVIVCSQQGGCP